MKYLHTLLLSTILLFGFNSYSQQFTQTVRGAIIDFDSKTPMIGAKVIVIGTSPIQGAIADWNLRLNDSLQMTFTI